MISGLLRNIRFYVLIFTFLLSGVIYYLVLATIPSGILQAIRLTEVYGLLAIAYLYFALLAGPLCHTFPFLPWRAKYLKARRSIGVSAFYFALLHTFISFFGQLDGFAGLGFLDEKYLLAVIVGFLALFVLFLLTITSLDWAVTKMTFPKWKFLHRFVYLASLLTIIHTLMLGTHYSSLSTLIPQITFFAVAFLLFLEAPRFDKLIARFMPVPHFGISFLVIAAFLAITFVTIVNPLNPSSSGPVSFDIHAAHKQLAAQALQQSSSQAPPFPTNIPGLNGDRNRRYTVSFIPPSEVQPNQDTTLQFKIYDAASGNPVSLFRILYAKPMHCIIVDSNLSYFSHIHPTQQQDGTFSVTTQFPHTGIYHIYISFQPFGGIEQQVGFSLAVGGGQDFSQQKANFSVDTNLTKTFGDYQVTLQTYSPLSAQNMTIGNDVIIFMLRDAKTKRPLHTLRPYLDAFGHLTMINEQTYGFLHVHPYSTVTPSPNQAGGPAVDFLPIGIYGPFKPGIYRVFAEFNPDGHLFTADFTVKVE